MPSKSGKQHRYMAMIAHNPAKAKEEGVPQSVAREFVEADKDKKFSRAKKRYGKRSASAD